MRKVASRSPESGSMATVSAVGSLALRLLQVFLLVLAGLVAGPAGVAGGDPCPGAIAGSRVNDQAPSTYGHVGHVATHSSACGPNEGRWRGRNRPASISRAAWLTPLASAGLLIHDGQVSATTTPRIFAANAGVRGAAELGGFTHGISGDGIAAINRGFGGSVVLSGSVDTCSGERFPSVRLLHQVCKHYPRHRWWASLRQWQ